MLELQHAPTTAPPHADLYECAALGRPPQIWNEVGHWSTELLDELDYGLLVVRRDMLVVHANQLARRRLQLNDTARCLRSSALWQPDSAGAKQLLHAVTTAVDLSLRSTVLLGADDHAIVLAVVPLRQRDALGHSLAAVLVQRERICTPLSLAGFGRVHGLTGAETSVLAELAAGHEPASVAGKLGVTLSTVRTHVVALRAKLGVRSLRKVLIDVSRLPPIAELVRL